MPHHSMSSQRNPDARDLRYLKLVTGRLQGLKDNEIVATIDGTESPAELYSQLARDGFPICETCGETHVGAGHCEKAKRKPREAGTEATLPDASGAAPLFRERIEALAEAVDNLSQLVQTFQGGRFVNTTFREGPLVLERDSTPEDLWEGACEMLGEDLDAPWITLPSMTSRIPGGATPAPPRILVMLIAAYVLSDGNMEDLLEALHPNPSEADAERLSRLIHAKKTVHGEDGLMRRAEQVATLVCGGRLGRGAPPAEVSPSDHNAACQITHLRELGPKLGWNEEKIYQELSAQGYTKEEFFRLSELQLRWPEG